MAIFYYGRRVTEGDSCYGIADYDDTQYPNLRITVFGAMPYKGHAYAMGVLAGYFEFSNPGDLKLFVTNLSNGNPSSVKATTGQIDVNSRMVEAANGNYYQENLTAPFIVTTSDRYGLGLIADDDDGPIAHGQSCDGSLMYFLRTATFAADADYSHASPEGKLAICLVVEKNEPPGLPDNFSPADGATITDTTPLLEADFNDENIILPNGQTSDYMQAYQVQIRSVSAANATTGSVVHDSGIVTASPSERTAHRASYQAPSLTPGLFFQMRWKMQDRLGDWSSWSHADGAAWSDFFLTSLGVVTLDGTPTGRTVDSTPDFQGRWSHGSSLQMTHARMQLFLAGASSPIRTSAEYDIANVNSAAPPGTLFTFPWASLGYSGANLTPGLEYEFRIQGKDSNGIYSQYSARRSFFINSKPNTPTDLRPRDSTPSTSRPIISFLGEDPDEADTPGLTAEARVKNSGGTVLETYAPIINADTGRWEQLTDSTGVPSHGTYKFDARTHDGDEYSDWSPEATFVYAAGPTVTITAPANDGDIIATDTYRVEWTTTDQQKKQIYLYRLDTLAEIHDSGLIVNTDAWYDIPADILTEGVGDFGVIVAITNSAPLTGQSAMREFELDYPAVDVLTNFTASPERGEFDVTPSAVRLTFDASTIDPDKFGGIIFRAREAGQPIEDAELIGSTNNIGDTSFVYWFPPHGVEMVYSAYQYQRESLTDLLRSDSVESALTITLKGTVICDVENGGGLRAVFESVQSRKSKDNLDQTEVDTWGGGPSWLFEGSKEEEEVNLKGRIRRTDAATVKQIYDAVRALSKWREDRSAIIALYRDERGRYFYGRVMKPEFDDIRLMRQDVVFRFKQMEYDDTVALG